MKLSSVMVATMKWLADGEIGPCPGTSMTLTAISRRHLVVFEPPHYRITTAGWAWLANNF